MPVDAAMPTIELIASGTPSCVNCQARNADTPPNAPKAKFSVPDAR